MSVTQADVAQGFRDLGLGDGDVVLMHSSLSSFGQVDGGADAVIDGVLSAVGRGGTLVVPTLTGSETLNPENPPRFDLRTQPCWTGIVPETLRQRPEAIRSTHPTHSCAAIGRLAEDLTHDHHRSLTPCGMRSPYFRVAMAGGYIAMAGCNLTACTTFHTVEEIARLPYVCQPDPAACTCIDRHGETVEVTCYLHSYAGPERDFPALEPHLLAQGAMRFGRVGPCEIRLIESLSLIEAALDELRSDPWYLTVRRGSAEHQEEC
ncbi:MAG: aminoglycoside N(3)-acetyltransferase [Nitrospiraceae bacterium]|nr:aminoglycoside N(3)-acetyltransferase [Nitrospiraceae bacterium]